jgi:ABC-type transporter Mla maintaining outer membrane lipid asymmetry ATPase subunit MlaF/ABC-type transporter Mla maintaining outer membrane lipid asymmetry permease subunit MlaE
MNASIPVILKGLTLRVGRRTLLAEASARFESGQISLIVGPSGVGKSTLLRVLAHLTDPHSEDLTVSGSIFFGDGQTAPSRSHSVSVGLVFQRYALFDELSPTENVRLASDHRPRSRSTLGSDLDPEALLKELGVPTYVATSALSGGQQQRLAIARTLAYDPAILLYDEPTSGLDVVAAGRVAQLIRRTQELHPKTSIIVTHDFETLTPCVDRIYLFDSVHTDLQEIPRERWGELGEMMRSLTQEENQTALLPERSHSALWISGQLSLDFFSGTAGLLGQLLMLPLRLLPIWNSSYWGGRFCLHYLRLVAGPLAMLYMAIAGVVIGFVATYFTFRFMPYRHITEPLVLENVLDALGFALYRILVPVLATILIAARSGAAVASDVGSKNYGQQIDALRTLGVKPPQYLLTPILYSFLLGSPLLVGIAFLVARFTSMWVFTASHPQLGPQFWHFYFHKGLYMPDHWLFRGTGWLLAKLLSCAAGIGLCSYLVGMRPKRSGRDVSGSITLNILLATIFVLLVHLAFALLEFY